MDCDLCGCKWANCDCSRDARSLNRKYKILLEALNSIVSLYGSGLTWTSEEAAFNIAQKAIKEAENE